MLDGKDETKGFGREVTMGIMGQGIWSGSYTLYNGIMGFGREVTMGIMGSRGLVGKLHLI